MRLHPRGPVDVVDAGGVPVRRLLLPIVDGGAAPVRDPGRRDPSS